MEVVLEESRRLGFLGPGEVRAHIAHAQGFLRAVGAAPARVLDLGSGGGVPGLVLATQWLSTVTVLLEGKERRIAFLERAARQLDLSGRVLVLGGRAEDLGRQPCWRGKFDLVVARSFGPPAVTAECSAPFLRVGGTLVVSEPPSGQGELHERWSVPGLAQLGLVAGERRGDAGSGAGVVADRAPMRRSASDFPPASFQVLHQTSQCPGRFPRRPGMPGKRPLF